MNIPLIVPEKKPNSIFTLGIKGRLYTGFAVLTLVLLIAMIFVIIRAISAENLSKQVIDIKLPTVTYSYDLIFMLSSTQNSTHAYALNHDPKLKTEFDLYWNNINKLTIAIDGFSNYWENSDLVNWNEVKNLMNQLKSSQLKVFDNSFSSTSQTVNQYITTNITTILNKIYEILDGKLDSGGERVGGMFDKQYKLLSIQAQSIIQELNNIKIIEYILVITSILISCIVAGFTAHKILPPLNNAIDIAKRIASNERNLKIAVISTDETGQLLAALDAMQASINENEIKLKKNEENTRQLFENIVKTANVFSQHSSRVAAGDLTQKISIENQDEMSQLGVDLNVMTEGLATITKKITEACHNMVSTIQEVKHSVDVQSSGATEQASSINQITASLEEIEKSSSQTIEKAKTLGEIAGRTRTKGQMGLEAVEQSVAGMKSVRDKVQAIAQTILDLSNQTQQVGEITAVVTTLAQQSKMLALNASIEAAKAGEAGKGFAVVAAEVKTLAEQSEQSTTQVQKILEDIRRATERAVMATEEGTKGVDTGTSLVEQTGKIVSSLSDVIHETTIASQQIEAAIRQEGIGIEQITAGMNEINQVTSTFVESVKQTNEAIDNLAIIAKSLKEYVDIYRL